MIALPVTLGYDQRQIGTIEFDWPHDDALLHQYVLAPSYYKKEDGTWEVLEYSLVQRALLAPVDVMEKREADDVA